MIVSALSVGAWSQVNGLQPTPASNDPDASAPAGNAPHDDAWLNRNIEEKCPQAAADMKFEQQEADKHRAAPVSIVSRPALQRELLLLVERDQAARRFTMEGATDLPKTDPRVVQMAQVDANNLHRLKQIVRQDGFPTTTMVGFNGVQAAFLLTQHADSDPAFQGRMLKVISERVRRGELDAQNFALLTDRVLVHQGKSQRYGTQFTGTDNELRPQPIEDVAHVDQRRKALGLVSLADYTCVLRVVYGVPIHTSDAAAATNESSQVSQRPQLSKLGDQP